MNERRTGTATRIVMVEFYPEVTGADVREFEDCLHRLAGRAAGLVRMQCGTAFQPGAGSEHSLNAHAPNVTFPHYASVWEFTDGARLDDFITDSFHKQLAGRQFSRFVKHRYVINITDARAVVPAAKASRWARLRSGLRLLANQGGAG